MNPETLRKLDRTQQPNRDQKPSYDAVEHVAVWFDEDRECWCWQYTLSHMDVRNKPDGGFVDRRLGDLPLQNPRIAAVHLHRALINDRYLGAFIPNPTEWAPSGAGPKAGWEFQQKQSFARADRMALAAQDYRNSLTSNQEA